MYTHKKTTLPNGLRIITVPMKDNGTVNVEVFVEAGSSYEDKKQNGISHFLEHMCFKGTGKRSTPAQIHREFDSLGAHHNAYTSREHTSYWVKAHRKHFARVLDLVADMYLHSTLPAPEVAKERGVILEEINMRADNPRLQVYLAFNTLLYGDQPAGRDVIGTKQNVKGFTRDDLLAYRTQHYVARATTIVVAGGITSREAVRAVREAFVSISTQRKHTKKRVREKQQKPKTTLLYKKTDQTHLILGVRAFDTHDKDAWAFSVLRTILGGSMSSRLSLKLREELGMAYYASAFSSLYTDHGYLGIAAGVTTKRTQEAIGVILEELRRMKKKQVSREELQRAKDLKTGRLFLGLETSDDMADFYGGQEVLGEPLETPLQMARHIRAVTQEDIQRVAKRIFKNNRLNLALIGPFKNKRGFEKVLHL